LCHSLHWDACTRFHQQQWWLSEIGGSSQIAQVMAGKRTNLQGVIAPVP
jgi:hypothetical protein